MGKLAKIFAREAIGRKVGAGLFNDGGRNAGAIVGGDFDPGEGAGLRGPEAVKEAGGLGRGGHEPERAAVGGGVEHGEKGVPELFGEVGGFVDDEEFGAVAADGFGLVGQGENARAVGEGEPLLRTRGGLIEVAKEARRDAEELFSLARGGGFGARRGRQ